MKRTVACMLLLSLCLGLCACGAAAPDPTPTPEPTPNPAELLCEKYAPVIDALEAGDYDGAIAAVTAMKPVPPVTEVQITLDNLWDYFEIREVPIEQTDAHGNLVYLWIDYLLTLKDGYELADLTKYQTGVAVAYEYDGVSYEYDTPCEIDFEAFTCSRAPSSTSIMYHSETVHYPDSYLHYSKIANNPVDQSNGGAYIFVFENLEFLSADGTLYLVGK